MKTGPGEPLVDHWQVIPLGVLVSKLLGVTSETVEMPKILAVDGRSGGGKSTLASRLQRHIARSTIVHTDDVAWHHSFFGWSDLLIDGVLRPARAHRPVAYRPPAWEMRSREGSIAVENDCTVVIVEGVGASRIELSPWLTASIWVQSDMDEAEHRGVSRDGGTGEAKRFWDEWMREENPFLEQQKPWARATVIVNGTPHVAHNPESEVVVAIGN